MKILVLSNLYPPDFLGGYELGCRQAVTALRAAGHDVRVLTAAPRKALCPTTAEPHVHRRLQLTDLYDEHVQRVSRLPAHAERYMAAHGLNAFNVHALCETLDDFEPDVVYCWNLIGLGGLGLLMAVQHMGTPWVMHLMDIVPLALCQVDPVRGLPPLKDMFLKLCRGKFISCSRTLLDEIAAGGLPLDAKSTLIPNWVPDAPDVPRSYKPDGILRLVAAGTLAKHKGTDLLIDACAQLHKRHKGRFTLDLFGHCTDPLFESMIQSHGLQNCVKYRGVCAQAELLDRYRHYDAFVFPTVEREPFGFAPMEAAAHGAVPIVSALCGFSEWFVDGVDCLKVDRTAEDVAAGIGRLLDGTIDVASFGRRAARAVRSGFTIDRILPALEDVLHAAANDRVGPSHGTEETYRLALLAERSFYSLRQELAA